MCFFSQFKKEPPPKIGGGIKIYDLKKKFGSRDGHALIHQHHLPRSDAIGVFKLIVEYS